MLNERFGKLVVLEKVGQTDLWKCRCDCGNEKTTTGYYLRKKLVKSCGCLRREQTGSHNITHGMTGSPEYHTYYGMLARCLNPKAFKYSDYGGRGIKICDRWLESFENFFEDMGKRPHPKFSLDRIDPNGDYTKENCRWADPLTQARNRRNSRRIAVDGIEKTVEEWCRGNGLNPGLVWKRMSIGWTEQDAVSIPLNKNRSKGAIDSWSGVKPKPKPKTLQPVGRPTIDITGQVFGRLTAVEPVGMQQTDTVWLCNCACGKQHTARLSNLQCGTAKSCGCYRRERMAKMSRKHEPVKVGDVHNSWTVVELIDSENVLCRCKCNATKIVGISNLLLNKSKCCKSCGTRLRWELIKAKHQTPPVPTDPLATQVST